MIKSVFLFIVSIFSLQIVNAQSETIIFDSVKEKFPNSDYVYLEQKSVIEYKVVENKVVQTINFKEKILVLTQNGIANLKFDSYEYDDFVSIENFKSSVTELKIAGVTKTFIHQDNRVIVKPPVKKISTNFVFYDGSMVVNYMYPNLNIGSIIETSYTMVINEQSFPNRELIGQFEPILNKEIIINIPNSIKVNCLSYNLTPSIKRDTIVKSNKKSIIISSTNCPKIAFEKNSIGLFHYAPHIVLIVDEFTTTSGSQKVLSDLSSLHHLYLKTLSEIEKETASNELIQLSKQITDTIPLELDKVKAIYYWIQDNIKYIAFEEGKYGYVPRNGNDTYRKRYGDCKDMASLVYLMTKAINIPVYLTWVGTRELPYDYSTSHNPTVDNHMISTYISDGQHYILDATNSIQDIHFPTAFIQGKELLIHKDTSTYEVFRVPIISESLNTISDSVHIEIVENVLQINKKIHLTGYEKTNHTYALLDLKESETTTIIQDLFFNSNQNIEIQKTNIENLKEREKDLNISIESTMKLQESNSKLFVPAFQITNPIELFDLTKRKTPISLNNTGSYNFVTTFKIPDNQEVLSLPTNDQFSSDFFEIESNFTQENNQVICKLSFKIKTLEIPTSAFTDLNAFQSMLKKELKKIIILIKK